MELVKKFSARVIVNHLDALTLRMSLDWGADSDDDDDAPTGSGKFPVCYVRTAALLDGVCVVVSPLNSSIQDHVRSLLPQVPVVILSGSISASATTVTIDN